MVFMVKPLRTLFMRIVLEKAIVFEERSYRFYEYLLGQAIFKDIFDLIKRLSGQELHHRIMLEEMQRRFSVKGADPNRRKQLEIGQLPSEELDALCEEWPVISAEDSRETILNKALHKERCACRFYRKMMKLARSDDLMQLFQTLLGEEMGHAADIEEELEKILH